MIAYFKLESVFFTILLQARRKSFTAESLINMTYFLLVSAVGVVVAVFVIGAIDTLLFDASNDDFKCGYTKNKEIDLLNYKSFFQWKEKKKFLKKSCSAKYYLNR